MSKLDLLRTPAWVYEPLGPIDMDPCSSDYNSIGEINLWDGAGEDGLVEEWKGFIYCNPPFSQKESWADKMVRHGHGILILPERGSAPWFGPLAVESKYYFVMGKKINFEGGPSSNNIGSVLFTFGKESIKRVEQSGLPGHFNKACWFRSRTNQLTPSKYDQ